MLHDLKAMFTSMACASGEETTLKIGEGKDLLIKFMEMSAPDEEGKRVLSFRNQRFCP